MSDSNKVQEIQVGGETNIGNEIVGAVAGVAARQVEGVSSLGTSSIRGTIAERVGGHEQRARGVGVEAGRREAILEIDLRVIYGFNIPEIVIKVRQNVARQVLQMCGLITKEININVVGVEFTEQAPGRVS